MADNCFWTDRLGVEEDCAGGGSDIPSGGYVYVLWGGLFSTYQEVRKYKADGSDIVGVRVAGSGFNAQDTASIYRANSLAVRMEIDGLPHIYVGEYNYASEWVEGELERRRTFTMPGGFRSTAPAFDPASSLVFGASNYVTSPSNPPSFLSNYVVSVTSTAIGVGDGQWSTFETDLDSMNGVASVVFTPDGACWTHDMSSTNQNPLYRGRLLRWPEPYGIADLVSTKIAPGSVNDFRELNGQICVYDGGSGPMVAFGYYAQNVSFEMELAIHWANPSTLATGPLFSFGTASFGGTSEFSEITGLQVAVLDGTLYAFCMVAPDGGAHKLVRVNIAAGTYVTIGDAPAGASQAGHCAYLFIEEPSGPA